MNKWVVQANPQKFLIDWYLDEYVRSNPNKKDWWLIKPRYQSVIELEDVIYVWKAASEPPHYMAEEYFAWLKSIGRIGQVAGIFAVGKIKGLPEPWPPPGLSDENFGKYRRGDSWNKLTAEDNWVSCIYKDNRARNPLVQETTWKKLGQSTQTDLGRFKEFRRGKTFVKLEPWEADVIDSLLANSK